MRVRACSVQGAACSGYVLAAARAWVHGSARVRADCGLQQDSMGSQMLHCRFQRLFELLDVDTAAFDLLAILLEHCTCGGLPRFLLADIRTVALPAENFEN